LDELIDDRGYNVLGVTVMPGPQLVQAVQDTRELKQRHPNLQIVWGGYFPTQHTDTVLRADYVDYAARSQGELTFIELMRALDGGDDVASIKGLSYKRSGEIVHNAPRAMARCHRQATRACRTPSNARSGIATRRSPSPR
ncbi:MAG: cobalamin B12-binding domain-containing protein, partial [Chloroflexi bacterium]|nr:cobalamin B12-binding domain-containing protein [Chloroflexota bacterium]